MAQNIIDSLNNLIEVNGGEPTGKGGTIASKLEQLRKQQKRTGFVFVEASVDLETGIITLGNTWQQIFEYISSGSAVFVKMNTILEYGESYTVDLVNECVYEDLTGQEGESYYHVVAGQTTFVADDPDGFPIFVVEGAREDY